MKVVEHELATYSWKVAKGKTVKFQEGMMYCISSNLALVEGNMLGDLTKLSLLMDENMIFEVKKGQNYKVKALENIVIIGISKEDLISYVMSTFPKGDFICMLLEGYSNALASMINQMAVLECPSASLRVRHHLRLYGEYLHLSDSLRAKLTNASRETICRIRLRMLKGD